MVPREFPGGSKGIGKTMKCEDFLNKVQVWVRVPVQSPKICKCLQNHFQVGRVCEAHTKMYRNQTSGFNTKHCTCPLHIPGCQASTYMFGYFHFLL